ncbi:MAG: hypothetical protein K8953_03380, partial [Proteobacteria bacterium]|nr:hypothetical protein [Pseudomonadota bacterium]
MKKCLTDKKNREKDLTPANISLNGQKLSAKDSKNNGVCGPSNRMPVALRKSAKREESTFHNLKGTSRDETYRCQ